MKRLIVILTLVFASASCRNAVVNYVPREDLFSIEIGPMEDQIALFSLEGDRGIRRIGFTMHDGLFYISDGNSGKILRYNSFGDLLFMVFNEETNPPPLTLRTNITEDEHATRWAFTYPFEAPGLITVDSRRHIFVEDRLPVEAQRTDLDARTVLDGIILQFDQDGRFINYIGREGIGGSPFPRIVGLSTSIRDELVVICRLPEGWNIYWFSQTGMLLYLLRISAASIPQFPGLPQAIFSVDRIMAAPDARRLFIKVNYSINTFDPATNIRTGMEPLSSIIWTLDVESGNFINYVEIPLFEIAHTGRGGNFRVFYSMLGVMRGGSALLYFPVETGMSVLFVNTNTREQRRGDIYFSNEDLRFNDFFLSPDGILSGMLVDNFYVNMVWWRTDRFVGDLM